MDLEWLNKGQWKFGNFYLVVGPKWAQTYVASSIKASYLLETTEKNRNASSLAKVENVSKLEIIEKPKSSFFNTFFT